MIPPRAGDRGRLHPFTPLVATLGTAVLAFTLPAPAGPAALYAAIACLALASGNGGAARAAALLCLPLWGFLVLLHAILPGGEGLSAAVAQGARLGAVGTASVFLLRTFDPSRFLDAVAERGWSFHAAYLVVATLQAVPTLRDRAAGILEAQRARGLRVGGSPLRRLRALVPVTLPLLFGTLAEVDERAMALETRGMGGSVRRARTPLSPPVRTPVDRLLCWGTVVASAVALVSAMVR